MNEIASGDATSSLDTHSVRESTDFPPPSAANEARVRALGGWSLPQLFEERVVRRPEAVAAQFEHAVLSYQALNSRANRIAHALIWAGIGPEDIVAVALPRSLDSVAALLGILKAGAAYLPLDPDYPVDRLAFMLRDAAPTRLITSSEFAPRLNAGTPTMILEHPDTAAALARMPDTNPSNGDRVALLEPRHLAYVIYTSGSTGRPKGVMVTHAGIANLATNQIERFAITADSRILQFASLSFDAAISELCLALVSGARLILAPASRLLPGEALCDLIAQTGATHATLPPTALAAMAAGSLPESLTLIVAGEACAPRLAEQWSVGRRMINAYGPTEATVCATMSEPLRGAGAPTLGKAIGNVQLHVLDDRLQPVATGVAGELYISGISLARGYLGQSALTAQRFLPNPFGSPGSRMYRSGDRVRQRDDGSIDFLGRVDHQVKIRGFRIETGEIETVLGSHVAVAQAAVIAREDHQGQQQLVSYVVAAPGEHVDATGLRRYLGELLPDYMIPAAVVVLDALPLTPNGKLDRAALPTPSFSAGGSAPSTPTEIFIAKLFAELLGIDQFGLHESFFDLGGHSIGATRLISQIRKAFGVKLELDDIYDAPSVAGLAARLEAPSDAEAVPLPVIARAERDGAIPLSFSQQRLWFLDQLDPGSPFYNMPGAVRLKGPLVTDALRRTLNEIVRRHESLRTTFALVANTPAQVVGANPSIDMPVTDLTALSAAESASQADWWVLHEKQAAFDLTAGPLLRVRLLRLQEHEHLLLMTVQHTVADGWSMALLVKEVAAIYDAFAKGLSSPLPDLAIQYADYAYWQRRWLSGAVLQRQLDYWKQQLAGSPEMLDLPTDRPRVPGHGVRGSAHAERLLPASLSAPLQALANRNNATLFMAMLAILDVVLARWSGQTDLVVGTVIAGRTHAVLEPMIGCFINFLPLRAQVSEQDCTNALLKRLTTTVRQAYAHQDAPFEKITEALNPKRGPSHNPIFNVGLLLQNFPEPTSPDNGLTIEMLPVTQDTATLDLRFVAQESPAGIHFGCEYRTDLYVPETIAELLDAFQTTLEHCVKRPDAPIGELPFSRLLSEQRAAHAARAKFRQDLVIAATFTAEPLRDVLAFWANQFGIDAEIEFAPYNQVFQTLLDPQSRFANNRSGVNVVLLRLEDWIRDIGEDLPLESRWARLRQNSVDLLAAIEASTGTAGTPLVVCLCPLSAALRRRPQELQFFEGLLSELCDALRARPGVHAIGPAELHRLYPVAQAEDEHTDHLGHIPYSAEMYGALATLLTRKLVALRSRPFKVIVLDCDNTLWQGICGEVGARGIDITPEFLALQRFMLAQSDAGMLLCLASKNNPEEVDAVFAHNDAMLLSTGSFVASRIGWQPKSQSIRELAAELQLGLDSFVFLDDSPIECAEVRANCPGVLVLQLPERPEQIPQFLDHVWVFDRAVVTGDAQQRTRQYHENRQREALRAGTSSFAEFLDSLALRVTIGPLPSTQLERAAELTQRTNQFNLRPQPRHAGEIRSLGDACLGVHVVDRFGDYGLTGVIAYEVRGTVLRIDTFLLSCRVLGRGVEHQVMARLGRIAEEMGCTMLALPCTETGKNGPMLRFLETVAGPSTDRACTPLCFTISSCEAARLRPAQAAESESPAKTSSTHSAQSSFDGSLVQQVADTLNTAQLILQRMKEATLRGSATRHDYQAPETATERQLALIWAALLNLDKIDVRDDFFGLGGHSLLATQAVSQIRTAFHIDLPLRALFEAPTLASLAAVIDEAQLLELDQFDQTELEAMLARLDGEDDANARGNNEQGPR